MIVSNDIFEILKRLQTMHDAMYEFILENGLEEEFLRFLVEKEIEMGVLENG